MTWVAILAVGAGSYLFRLGPLLVFERISLTERGTAPFATPAPQRSPR